MLQLQQARWVYTSHCNQVLAMITFYGVIWLWNDTYIACVWVML